MAGSLAGLQDNRTLVHSALAVAGAGWLLWMVLVYSKVMVLSALGGAGAALLLRIRPSRGLRFAGLTTGAAFLVPFLHSMVVGWRYFRELWNDPGNLPPLIALTGWRFLVPAVLTGLAVWWEIRLTAYAVRTRRLNTPG